MVARKGQPNANVKIDPGYKPDWKERARAHGPEQATKRFMFRTTWDFVALLRKAARRRDMSDSAYARRAVSAFIAADLQMPFEDVCETSPPVPFARGRWTTYPRDDGKGYGNWEVKP